MTSRQIVFVAALLAWFCAGCAPAPAETASAGPGSSPQGGSDSNAGTDAGAPARADAGAVVPTAACAPTNAGPGAPDEAEPGLDASCEGRGPAGLGTPAAADFDLGTTGADCTSATSDGAGRVALLLRKSAFSSYQPYALFVAPDGGLEPGPLAAAAAPQPSGFAFAGAHLDPQYGPHDGFFQFSFVPDPPPLVGKDVPVVAAAPGGGALVASATWSVDRWSVSAARFDAAGRQSGATARLAEGPAQGTRPLLAVAVSLAGDGLVAFSGSALGDPGSVYGVWVARDGSSDVRPVRLGAGAPHALLLRPLADGSLAVRLDDRWVARARPSAAVEAAPAWLAALSGRDVLLRASGQGYVVPWLAFDSATSCASLVQLRAPAGNLCATIGVRGAALRAELGLDGTLFATFAGPPCAFGACCHVRWWRGALP